MKALIQTGSSLSACGHAQAGGRVPVPLKSDFLSILTFDTDRLGNTPQKHEEKHIDIWKNEFLSAFGDINGKLIQTCKPCDKVYKCQEHLIIANAFYQARAELFNLDFDDRAYGLNPDRQKLRIMYSDIVNALVGNYNSTSGDCSL